MKSRLLIALFLFFSYVPVVLPRISSAWMPRVSIITSVYDGDEFIEGFMYDITRQTIFDQCELIMINANSPGNEEVVIKRYMEQYPNIIYKKLDHDPGIYAVWNMAIKMARGIYITNANLDDRLKPDCYEVHATTLRKNLDVDLVYSDFFITYYPNETFEVNRYSKLQSMPQFSQKNMKKTLPNNHPMWRKSFHKKYGLFDERYKVVGDWQMWLRATKAGAKFLKVPGVYGLFYINPKGLSNEDSNPLARKERIEVYRNFKDMFVAEQNT